MSSSRIKPSIAQPLTELENQKRSVNGSCAKNEDEPFPRFGKLNGERIFILISIVLVFLGPSIILEWNFGERANYFTNSRTSNLEIVAYYQSFRGIQQGIPPWRDPQTLGTEDRFLLPSMAIPQIIGAVFTAPFDTRVHWGGNLAVTFMLIGSTLLLFPIAEYLIPSSRSLQAASIGLLIFGGQYMYGKSAILNYIKFDFSHIYSQANGFLYLNRVSSPGLTIFFAILASYLGLRAYHLQTRNSFTLFGLSVGLLAYSYFYHWQVFSLIFALLILSRFFTKDFETLKKMIPGLVLYWICSLPFLCMSYFISQTPYGHDLLLRRGFETNHSLNQPIEFVFLIVALPSSIFFFSGKIRWVWTCTWIASILVLEIRILIGLDYLNSHIIWHFIAFALPLWLGTLLDQTLSNKREDQTRFIRVTASGILLIAILFAFLFQLGSLKNSWSNHQLTSDELTVITELKKMEPGTVLAESIEKSSAYALYSHQFPILPHSAFPCLTNSEMLDRLISTNLLIGKNREFIFKELDSALINHLLVPKEKEILNELLNHKLIEAPNMIYPMYVITSSQKTTTKIKKTSLYHLHLSTDTYSLFKRIIL